MVGSDGAVLANLDWLPHDVPIGSNVTFNFDVTAPVEFGTYSLRLAQHGVELFGEAVSVEVSGELVHLTLPQ